MHIQGLHASANQVGVALQGPARSGFAKAFLPITPSPPCSFSLAIHPRSSILATRPSAIPAKTSRHRPGAHGEHARHDMLELECFGSSGRQPLGIDRLRGRGNPSDLPDLLWPGRRRRRGARRGYDDRCEQLPMRRASFAASCRRELLRERVHVGSANGRVNDARTGRHEDTSEASSESRLGRRSGTSGAPLMVALRACCAHHSSVEPYVTAAWTIRHPRKST